MDNKIRKSIELYERAVDVIPGGVNSPVRAFRSVGGQPIFMKSGKGPVITDVDGNGYIDYCMSWGPLILGHADPDVVKAVLDTAVNGTSFGTPNPFEVEIAEMMTDRVPCVEKVRFVNSGTEAVMSAVRLARGYTGRDKIIKFDGCYHGHADYLLVAAGSGLATLGVPDSEGVTKSTAADTIVVPFNDAQRLEDVLKKEHGSVAAVIMEPVPCNYGLIIPRKGYLEDVRNLCDKYETLLIFDEVITGFRLSRGGAQSYYNVMPDIVTHGKIIGGGLPVGAYGSSADIMSKIAPEGPVYQAGTLSGNPLAMAAGIATLKKLDTVNAWSDLREKARRFRELLKPALDKYAGRLLFSSLESIFTFTFTRDAAITKLDDVKRGDMKLFAEFHRGMLKRGIYLAPSGFEVGFLSTSHGEDELAKTAAAVMEVLDDIMS